MAKKNKFGLWSIVLLGINSIIGTGIFLLPGKAFALTGTSSMFVYLFVALLAGSIALCFAEAAGIYSANGGAYIYAKKAFGNFAGFEVGVMKYIVQIIAWAAMAAGFVTALSAAFPIFATGFWHNFMIIALVGSLTIINLLGIDPIRFVNNIITVGKLTPLLIFILAGVFFINWGNFNPVVPESLSQSTFSSAAILIFYAFTGFEAIATASEDMENPKRNVPIAIALSVAVVFVVYVFVQFVAIGVLGSDLAHTTTPLATAISSFLGQPGMILVTVGTLISIGGINIACSFHTPRGCAALAEQHMLPPVFAKRNRKGVQWAAILLSGVITIPLALSGSFVYLAAISTISRFAQYIPTVLAVIKFKKDGLKSTFTMPFGYVIPVLALVVALWLLFNADHLKLIIGLGAMIVLVPLYFVMKYYNKKHGVSFEE